MKYFLSILFSIQSLLINAQQPDLLNSHAKIIFNAKIFTGNKAQPYAEAVAIVGDKIIAVGTLIKVKKSAGPKAVLVDMDGRLILPGFIDSHTHSLWGGLELMYANLYDSVRSVNEIAEYARKVRDDKTGMVGNFLVIEGINIGTWSLIKELAGTFDSGEFASLPVVLNGSDGHTHWGNNAVMKLAGLDRNFLHALPEDRRKYYGIDNGDEPNGFVADSGFVTYKTVIPGQHWNWEKAGEKALEYSHSYGITAWLDPSLGDIKDSVNHLLDEYLYLVRHHQLTAHIAAVVVADADADPAMQINVLKSLQAKYNTTKDFKIIGFKIFADGVVEFPTQTAALSQPYSNTGNKGPLMFDAKKFGQFVTAADKSGLLVHVHAIGDRAVTETLNGFEIARHANGNSGISHTVTHLQFVMPSDIPRFKKLGLLASVQLMWALGDITTIDIVKPYVAPEIYKWQYPARSLLNAGAVLCGASDWPVSSGNPFEAIYEAETRKGRLGVLDSTQCVPRVDMLYAYTINAAKSLQMEKYIGSIAPGKSADMILVDRDVLLVSPEVMHNTKVLWTMFKGKVVYKKN
ncbi:MAG: amidohydrolase [Ginsengibacter sp.]